MTRSCDPNYTDNRVYLFDFAVYAQLALDRLARTATKFGIFSLSRCKVLLQDWMSVFPKLMPDGKELTVVGHFGYLKGSTKDRGTIVEVDARASKARAT